MADEGDHKWYDPTFAEPGLTGSQPPRTSGVDDSSTSVQSHRA